MIKMNLKEYNQLQIILILESNLSADKWIYEYSKKFNKIITASKINDVNVIKEILYS